MRITYLILLLPFSLHAEDWPEFHGPNRNGISQEKNILREWPKSGPQVLWKHKAGSGWAAPIVVDNRVYLFHRIKNDEVIDCLDATQGKLLWSAAEVTRYRDDFDFDDGPRATPLISNETIITLGANGDLIARELKAGKQLWKKNIIEEYQVPKGFFGVASSPIVVGGNLLLNVGGKKASVVAFDLKTGKELWKNGEDGVSYSSPISGHLDDEEVAIFFTRAGLLVVEPKKGQIRHRYPWRPRLNASVNAASPILVGNEVFLTTSYSTGAVLLELKKGTEPEPIWKNDESLSAHYNTPIYYNGYLYGVDGRQESIPRLRCVEWKTGKVQWTENKYGCASLILADGVILALLESGELALFDANPKSYKEFAKHPILTSPTRAAMALSNGVVFARDSKTWVAVKISK